MARDHTAVNKTIKKIEEKNEQGAAILVPERDPLTGGLVKPLDYKDTMILFKEQAGEFDRRENRVYASELGSCLRELYYKRTGVPLDEGQEGFDDGIGARGNAVEDRITLMMRDTHDPDSVLQNVRLSKVIRVPDPRPESKGEPFSVAMVTRTDPVVVGDNFEVLQLWEIKTKAYFPQALESWSKEGVWKVPLFMAKVDGAEANGAASLHNLMQVSIEARILRESGKAPAQVLLHYVMPNNLKSHLSVLVGPTDVEVISELAIRWTEQFFHYYLQRKVPPPMFSMGWQCRYCDWAKRCAATNKETGESKEMNPLFIGINARLDKARGQGDSATVRALRTELDEVREALQIAEQKQREAYLADLPLHIPVTTTEAAPKRKAR